MPNIRRRNLIAAGLAGVSFVASGQSLWPGERPISLIVPFPPRRVERLSVLLRGM